MEIYVKELQLLLIKNCDSKIPFSSKIKFENEDLLILDKYLK